MCPILEIARQSPGIKLILLLLQPWLGCHVSVVRRGWKMAVNQIDISSNILIINKTVNKATLRHSSLSLNLHEDGYVGNQEMMSLAPQSRFGNVPFCFIHSRCEPQLCVWCDLLGPILIVSLSAFQMSPLHSSLCVALLASSAAGQAPSGGFMDNINFDDFIHRSQTPG